MPLRQVRVEYDQYELRRRLVSQFDLFLSDGRIAGHMLHLLGKEVYKRRKWVSLALMGFCVFLHPVKEGSFLLLQLEVTGVSTLASKNVVLPALHLILCYT
jgi:hypothetical protein